MGGLLVSYMIRIGNRKINADTYSILSRLKSETGYLKDIKKSSNGYMCTCPYHSNGAENHPSCSILDTDNNNLPAGTFHCFACGTSGSLAKLIAKCYGKSDEFGRQWLVQNYGDTYIDEVEYLPKIEEQKKETLDESVLNQFEYDNQDALNYLINKRHLKKEVLEQFKIGFDKETNNVTFPCRDEHGKLVGIFTRNIYSKFFSIPKIQPKPIFLLDNAIKNSYSEVYVVESQINALTLYGWGFPAIALFGTGSSDQYAILNKSGIRKYVLCFDGDLAGEIGANKFSLNVKNAIFEKVFLPKGADVNDLTKEEFLSLPREII